MKKNIIYILFIILLSSIVLSVKYVEEYNNPLTRSIADTIYCKQYGECTLSNLSIIGGYLNITVENYNVTGSINGDNIYLDGWLKTPIVYLGENGQNTNHSFWLQERPSATNNRIMMYGKSQSNAFGFVVAPNNTAQNDVHANLWTTNIDGGGAPAIYGGMTLEGYSNSGALKLFSSTGRVYLNSNGNTGVTVNTDGTTDFTTFFANYGNFNGGISLADYGFSVIGTNHFIQDYGYWEHDGLNYYFDAVGPFFYGRTYHYGGIKLNDGQNITFGTDEDSHIKQNGTDLRIDSNGNINISPLKNVILGSNVTVPTGDLTLESGKITIPDTKYLQFTSGEKWYRDQIYSGGSNYAWTYWNGSAVTTSMKIWKGDRIDMYLPLNVTNTINELSISGRNINSSLNKTIPISIAPNRKGDGTYVGNYMTGIGIKFFENATKFISNGNAGNENPVLAFYGATNAGQRYGIIGINDYRQMVIGGNIDFIKFDKKLTLELDQGIADNNNRIWFFPGSTSAWGDGLGGWDMRWVVGGSDEYAYLTGAVHFSGEDVDWAWKERYTDPHILIHSQRDTASGFYALELFHNYTNGGVVRSRNMNLTLDSANAQVVLNKSTTIKGNIQQENGNTSINNYYADMFFHEDDGISVTLNNTFQIFSLFNESSHNNGFEYSRNSTLRLLDDGGVYQVHWILEGDGTQNHEYEGYVYVNEVPIHNTYSRAIGTAVSTVTMSGFGFIDINTGDNVTLRLSDRSGTTGGTAYFGNINLVRIGNIN